MSHTLGTWDSESSPDILADNEKHVATCWNNDRITPGEADDNARLIAAAPDLLAACQLQSAIENSGNAAISLDDMHLLFRLHGWDGTSDPYDFAWQFREAAIAKAKGETA